MGTRSGSSGDGSGGTSNGDLIYGGGSSRNRFWINKRLKLLECWWQWWDKIQVPKDGSDCSSCGGNVWKLR